MTRSRRSVLRTRGSRRERKAIIIVTEGQTEKQYVEGLRQYLRPRSVQVTACKVVDAKGEPSKVLKTALGRKHDSAVDYDEILLFLDVGEHASLSRVLTESRRTGMKAIVSNPCFEVWIVWHFQEIANSVDRDAVQRMARGYGVDKNVPANFSYGCYSKAVERASRHQIKVNHVGPNPSTAIPLFISMLHES